MDLLSIDVASEIETLCRAQLRGTWQVPAELVRLALRLGATTVTVDRARRGFVVSWSGRLIDAAVLEDLRTVFDRNRPPADRQRAIAAVEESGTEALLWAAGLRGARLRVTCSDGAAEHVFDSRRLEMPIERRAGGPGGIPRVEAYWRCPSLDWRRALNWLELAVRFAEAEISIGGRPAARGFVHGLFQVRVTDPLPSLIGITASGEEPGLWLLRDGVVSTRASIPGYPPFEAAVELSSEIPPRASAADMRRAVGPHVGELVDRAVWMMLEISRQIEHLAPEIGGRLTFLLLRAAHLGLRTREIEAVRMVPTAASGLLSIAELRRLAAGRRGLVPAIDPGDPIRGDAIDPRSTVVAAGEVRDLLSQLTGARFQATSRSIRGRGERIASYLRGLGHRLHRRARGVVAGRDVDVGELSQAECDLFEALQAAALPLGVRICEGGGAASKAGGTVVVPRGGLAFSRGARLFATDPAWLYPIIVALDLERDPSAAMRRRWLDAVGVVREAV